MRFAFLLFLLFFVSGMKAEAFDRIHCQSDMKDWLVALTEESKTAVLTPANQTLTLSEEQSHKLVILGSKAETIATVFPWNSLYVRVPAATKKNFEIKSTEASNGFLIEIMDLKSKVTRSLNCRFTF